MHSSKVQIRVKKNNFHQKITELIKLTVYYDFYLFSDQTEVFPFVILELL